MLPGVALLLLVRWAAERVRPGFGPRRRDLGLGTIVMTFGAEYFSMSLGALGFGSSRC